MLRVWLPAEYHSLERHMRVPCTMGFEMSGSPEKHGKAVWAVADQSAEVLKAQSYLDYEWPDECTLCLGHDEESLYQSGLIKPEHDVITIPNMIVSLHVDQALAVLLAHYAATHPCAERDAKVAAGLQRVYEIRERNGNTTDTR